MPPLSQPPTFSLFLFHQNQWLRHFISQACTNGSRGMSHACAAAASFLSPRLPSPLQNKLEFPRGPLSTPPFPPLCDSACPRLCSACNARNIHNWILLPATVEASLDTLIWKSGFAMGACEKSGGAPLRPKQECIPNVQTIFNHPKNREYP